MFNVKMHDVYAEYFLLTNVLLSKQHANILNRKVLIKKFNVKVYFT